MGTERHLLCIEDPFELSHDLGRTVHAGGCWRCVLPVQAGWQVCFINTPQMRWSLVDLITYTANEPRPYFWCLPMLVCAACVLQRAVTSCGGSSGAPGMCAGEGERHLVNPCCKPNTKI